MVVGTNDPAGLVRGEVGWETRESEMVVWWVHGSVVSGVHEGRLEVLTRGEGSLFGKHRRALPMGRVAKAQQQARTEGRQRRIAADFERAVRDKRVEAAAAEAILALGARDDATREVRAAEVLAGDALARIIAAGVNVGGAARLCHLSVGQVQRFRQVAQQAKASRGHVGSANPNPPGSVNATLPARGDDQARLSGQEQGSRSHERAVEAEWAR